MTTTFASHHSSSSSRSFAVLSRRVVGFVCAAAAAVACGSEGDDKDKANDDTASSAEAPVFFVANEPSSQSAPDAIFVASISPSTGEVTKFGPAIPNATSLTHHVSALQFSKDRSRVIVTLAPIDETARAAMGPGPGPGPGNGGGPETPPAPDTSNDEAPPLKTPWLVLASDGVSWHTLEESRGGEVHVEASRDLSLVWMQRYCNDNMSLLRPALATWDGRRVLDTPTCVKGRETPLLDGFGKSNDSAFFIDVDPVHGRSNVVVRKADGTSRLIKQYPLPTPTADDDGSSQAYVTIRRNFDTSLLVSRTESGKPTSFDWIDFDGNTIDVPNFSMTEGEDHSMSYDTKYVVRDRDLFLISDRKVEKIGRVPVKVNATDVQGYVKDKYILVHPVGGAADGGLQLVDLEGNVVSTYQADGNGTPSVSTGFLSITAAHRWAVVPVSFFGPSGGDYIPMTGYGEDLVAITSTGALSSMKLRRVNENLTAVNPAKARLYQPSSTGAHLFYADATSFHRVDVDAKSDDVLKTTMRPVIWQTSGLQTTSWILQYED